MERKLLSELRGTGKVFRGDQLLMEAPYAIDIYQEYAHGIPTLKDIDGRVEASERDISRLVGEELSLEFQDGYRLGFFFKDGHGKIGNTTGILAPEHVS